MIKVADDGPLPDADIIAYLDDRLPPTERASFEQRISQDREVRARMAMLADGGRPFAEAFEPLLGAAPVSRLETWLAATPAYRRGDRFDAARLPRLALAAAALAIFLGGFAADRVTGVIFGSGSRPGGEQIAEPAESWRQAVAEYLALYTADTLASIPDDAAIRAAELAAVAAKVKIGLSAQRIALPDLAFKRAQILDYDGSPLGQIAYLDPASGPVALCVIANGAGNAAPRPEQRNGLNIVHWAAGGRAFMLIGRLPALRLQRLAETLEGRLSS